MSLALSKYQGLGNDFIVVDGLELPTDVELGELGRRLCDRHFGVGADGVLSLLAPNDDVGADARMLIVNSDGSRPEMCGNGIRCFALHLARTRDASRGVWRIETDAGLMTCQMVDGGRSVTVEMGRADFRPEASGVSMSGGGSHRVEVEGATFAFELASMGNPHAVCVVTDPAVDLGAVARRYGRAVSTHESFEAGVNAEWIRVGEAGVEFVVFERGAGLTLACGTGACAAAAVVVRRRLWSEPHRVPVHLPGGALIIDVTPDTDTHTGPILMTGPAVHIFDATLEHIP